MIKNCLQEHIHEKHPRIIACLTVLEKIAVLKKEGEKYIIANEKMYDLIIENLNPIHANILLSIHFLMKQIYRRLKLISIFQMRLV